MKNTTTRVGERVWLTSVVPALLALLVAGLLASAGCASVAYLPGVDARSSHQPTDEKLPGSAPQPSDDKVLEAYGKLPLGFVPNQGQVGEGQVRYHAQAAAFGFYFTPMGVRLSFFEDASGSEASSPTGEPSTRGAALALH